MHPAIPVVLIAVSTAIKIAKKLQQSTPLGRADKSSRKLNLSKGADMHPVIPIVLIAVSTAIKVAKKLQQSAPLGKADKFSLNVHFNQGGSMDAEVIESIEAIIEGRIDLFDQHSC